MAHTRHKPGLPAISVDTIADNTAVMFSTDGTPRGVKPVASVNDSPAGVAPVGVASGKAVSVQEQGAVVKLVAAASLGQGANIGHASSNGAVGPVAAASGVLRYRIGVAQEAAAAGTTFSVYLDPRALSGLA